MDNPGGEKTTVNVKGVEVEAWNKARQAALKRAEPMGEWLSRAVVRQAEMERMDMIVQPYVAPEPEAPRILAPEPAAGGLNDVAALLGAMVQAGVPVQKRVGRRLNAVLHHFLGGEPAPVPQGERRALPPILKG